MCNSWKALGAGLRTSPKPPTARSPRIKHADSVQRTIMRHITQKMTASLLAAILAAVACFGHALHEVAHFHFRGTTSPCPQRVGQACCPTEAQYVGGSEVGLAKGCSHSPTSTKQTSFAAASSPHHDRSRCAICRFLALPQFAETPQNLLSNESAVYGRVAVPHTSPFLRRVSLVTIRGPPV
jgi:hypothetical protein